MGVERNAFQTCLQELQELDKLEEMVEEFEEKYEDENWSTDTEDEYALDPAIDIDHVDQLWK